MKKFALLFMVLQFALSSAFAMVIDLDTNIVRIKNKRTKEKLVIRTKRTLCRENDVLLCDFALVDIEEEDGKVYNMVSLDDKISIYTVIESINVALCKKAHHCKFEYPYQKTVTMIKDFKGAAVIQTPFYLISDTIRLPYVIGKAITQALRFKMKKGRKIIKNLYPLNENRKDIQVKFNDKNYRKIIEELTSSLYTVPSILESIDNFDLELIQPIQIELEPQYILGGQNNTEVEEFIMSPAQMEQINE